VGPTWACRGCGAGNPEGDGFCGLCGLRAVALEPATEVASEPWSCRECGAAGRVGTAYCGSCGARWAGTRVEDLRLVTALFADISGFTTLADTLETEDLHDVINPLIGGLARIAEKYDGFITKYAGDALLVIYGAPVAHEDDAQRALLTALEMHAALPSLLEQIGPDAAHLTIHVGVNTGKVVAGRVGSDAQADYSVLGDSVILAQRLESVCPSGQTYVGPSTHELCKDEFDFESVGELTLKGKLKPVEGFRLVGRRRAGTATERPLVGRSTELAVVDEVLDAVEAGSGVLMSLSGEPGGGKSRLLAEARTRATGRGLRWLPARCLSYGSALPYWPFADLLRQALGLRVEDPPEETRARLWDVLPSATMVGAERLLGLPVEPVGPEQARREVHDALASWLTMLAERSPVVLSIEDVHWADTATLEVLGELVRTTRSLGVGVVVTSRPEGDEAVAALSADADRRHLDVGPLSPGAVAELAGDVLSLPVGTELLHLLTERTRGNPLFVEELCRSLQETGALVPTSAGTDLRPGYDVESVPGTVERVFSARVDALPPHALDLLSTCSVVGRISRLSLLTAVVEDDPRSTLDLLVETGLLDRVVDSDEPALAFHHALLHDVVYNRILRKQKRALHRRVADVGRQLYGDSDVTVDLLARHLYLADAGLEAVDPLLRAGRRAVRLYANEAAAQHFARAREVLERSGHLDARWREATIQLATCEEHRGAFDAALSAFERVAEAYPDDVAALRGVIAVLRASGAYDAAVSAFSTALSVVDPRSPASAPVWLEGATTLSAQGRFSDAISSLRTALRLLPTDEAVARGRLLVQLAHAEEKTGRLSDGVLHGQEAVRLLDRPEAHNDLVKALRVLGAVQVYAGDHGEARSNLLRAHEVALRIGRLDEAAGAMLNLGLVSFEQEDYAAAAAAFREAMPLFDRLGIASGRALSYGNLADALSRLGEPEEAELWADRAIALASETGNGFVLADATRTKARLLADAGDATAAQRAVEHAADLFLSIGDEADAVDALELAIRWAEQRHDEAGAQRLAGRLLELGSGELVEAAR
jgi:adenylate cyclase